MFARENLFANANDKGIAFVIETPSGVVGAGRCLLEDGVCRNHFSWHQLAADTEVFQRALRLCAPELRAGHLDFADAVGFLPGCGVLQNGYSHDLYLLSG
jgi:hypothetical protein